MNQDMAELADYVYRIASSRGHIDLDRWQRAKELAQTDQDVSLVPLEDGTVVCECIPYPPGYLTAEAYRMLGGERIEDYILYAAGIAYAYDRLVQEGKQKDGTKINVCVATDSAAFAGCVLAQETGVPIYTVIGAENELQPYAKQSKALAGAELLDEIAKGKQWQSALPDVVAGVATRLDEMDTIATLWDELGYLAHPDVARGFYVADLYRAEAENRHTMMVVAHISPYRSPLCVHEAMMEYEAKDEESAIKTLAIETGWEQDDEAELASALQNIAQSIQ